MPFDLPQLEVCEGNSCDHGPKGDRKTWCVPLMVDCTRAWYCAVCLRALADWADESEQAATEGG